MAGAVRRGRRPMLAVAVGLGAVVLVCSACGAETSGASRASGPPATTDGGAASPGAIRPADEMVAEYRAALADPDLDLPAGVTLPATPLTPTGGRAAGFEEGFGAVEAAEVWRCAWQHALLDAVDGSDADATREIGDRLLGYYDLPAVRRHVEDPGHHWYEDVVAPALDGEVEPLREDLELSCHPGIGD